MVKRRWSRSRRGYSLMDVAVGTFLMSMAVSLFVSLYPTASVNASMSGQYAQAANVVQHKVDQLRALGYGRLVFDELRAANAVDASSPTSPYRFEVVDGMETTLRDAVGTIAVEPAGPSLARVTIRLQWHATPGRTKESSHEVTILIANE